MDCNACKSLTGEKKISPGMTIYDGQYWVVEHAYPSALLGWLVIVLKHHKPALHQLSEEEFAELGLLQQKTVHALRTYFKCEKEYIACFSEGQHFEHIHFHVIPKTDTVTEELKGFHVFELLKADKHPPVPEEQVRDFCYKMKVKCF